MEEIKTVNEWRSMTTPALESKKNELLEAGYTQASHDDVWNCLVKKVWQGNPSKRLYEVIQDILHLSTGIYISYLTVNAYQEDTDLMESIAALTKKE
ncbi:MAG TPA: post-transcriptional regulator [Virgibacillus sp.]|nr:post-transcriptional regulator [Virgibacillus sp.]